MSRLCGVAFGVFRLLILVSLVVCGAAGTLWAATPSSGAINTPADDAFGTKQTLTYTAGPFAGGTTFGTQTSATVAGCLQAVTPPGLCDSYSLTVNLPGD